MNPKIHAALAATVPAAGLTLSSAAHAAPKAPQIDVSGCPYGDVCAWTSPSSPMTALTRDMNQDLTVYYAYNNTGDRCATLMTPGSLQGEYDGVVMIRPDRGKTGPWSHISGAVRDDTETCTPT
ncbi:hypothetical protein ACF1GS_38260 [Streptomyces eurythermus]|uniref:hypothetical protein n=1 Tax=Streptomyces eurythermus TaxID=42237 RepID=UPI0036F971A3